MPNGNDRGNTVDRARRRAWLVSTAAPFGGDGTKVACWECGAMVTEKTLYVDRIIPAHEGGRYRRDNIRPHCCTCSHREGQRVRMMLARAASPYGDDDRCRACGVHWLDTHPADCPSLIAGMV